MPKPEVSITPEAAQALYKRVSPFLQDLYGYCLKLGTEKKLASGRLNKLAKKHQVTDLNLPPDTLLPVIAIDLKPAVEASQAVQLNQESGVALIKDTGLSVEQIRLAPWPMVLTQWHLLASRGTPPNQAFANLYGLRQG